jgi:hypothetical protein
MIHDLTTSHEKMRQTEPAEGMGSGLKHGCPREVVEQQRPPYTTGGRGPVFLSVCGVERKAMKLFDPNRSDGALLLDM